MAINLSQVANGSSQLFKQTINDNTTELTGYISTNQDSIDNKLSTLQGQVGSSDSGLIKDVSTLKTEVEDSNTGLIKKVDDHQTSIESINTLIGTDTTSGSIKGRITVIESDLNTANTGLKARTNYLEGIVGLNATSGLRKAVADNTSAISTLDTTVGGHTASIDTLGTRMTTAESDIDALENKMPVAHTGTTTMRVIGYDSTTGKMYYDNNGTNGVYVDYTNSSNPVLMGAAWNDYAEFRQVDMNYEAGTVVHEFGDGILRVTDSKRNKCTYVISDTYGMTVGANGRNKKAVALCGRVLVYIGSNIKRLHIGDVVCAGKDGMAYKMSRLDIILHPDRILGIVSEIPNYETWNGVQVNGRVWIKIK